MKTNRTEQLSFEAMIEFDKKVTDSIALLQKWMEENNVKGDIRKIHDTVEIVVEERWREMALNKIKELQKDWFGEI